jgi:hypothetical protein
MAFIVGCVASAAQTSAALRPHAADLRVIAAITRFVGRMRYGSEMGKFNTTGLEILSALAGRAYVYIYSLQPVLLPVPQSYALYGQSCALSTECRALSGQWRAPSGQWCALYRLGS